MHHPTERIAHTTAFVTPVVVHWLERERPQWVHPMKDRSDDPSHHERALLPRSYISLLGIDLRFIAPQTGTLCHWDTYRPFNCIVRSRRRYWNANPLPTVQWFNCYTVDSERRQEGAARTQNVLCFLDFKVRENTS